MHSPRTTLKLISFLLLAAALAPRALAGGGGGDDGAAACLDAKRPLADDRPAAGFDPGTGRDLRHFPPHRLADISHMKLEVMIPDMDDPNLSATETLTIRPAAGPVDSFSLDAHAMTIKTVAALGHETRFKYDNNTLSITFTPPIDADETVELVTSYTLHDPPLGLVWTPESPAWPGRAAQIHTQGQPETNSFWFPCIDFPNAKMTTELVATVPAGFTVCSNGRLLSQQHEIIAADGITGIRTLHPYDTFDWLQDKPQVAYLVTMVVGKFDIVDVGTKKLPMPVYAPVGRGRDVKATFGRTKDMIALFEKLTGQTYPWDKYAQLLVWNFGSGGMENTSATSLYDSCILEPSAFIDHDTDGLISHELAHQWFGDLATCNSWEHTWLNEGFATYMTSLWFEHRDGKHAYQNYIIGQFNAVLNGDKGEAPADVGMCSKIYAHPWEAFRKPSSPYSKGSSILHMLRTTLGDDDFFKGVQLYLARRRFQTAETSDLRTALEEVTGRNLEKFFWQWCTRPGAPHLTINPVWDDSTKTLTVTINQTQRIDGDNPAFEFDLPLQITCDADEAAKADKDKSDKNKSATRMETIPVSAQSTTWSITLDSEPKVLAFDPDMSVLASLTITQPTERWAAQLQAGGTVFSRVQACRGLKSDSTPQTAELLRKTAADRKQATPVRTEAVKSLAARGSEADLQSLSTGTPDSWEVRIAVIDGLISMLDLDQYKNKPSTRSNIEYLISQRASKDKSIRVRGVAVEALAKLKSEFAATIITTDLKTNSQSDELRQAALEALADLDSPKSLQNALIYAMPGHDTRTRPVAVGAIAKLGHQDNNAAFKALVGYLADPELRTQRAAGQALVDLKDPRADAEFDKLAATARSDELKQQVEDWKKALKEKLAAK